jgi:hypothetical protein
MLAVMSGEVVQGERPCFRCGYSLRGLLTTAQCPECGSPVAVSLRGDLLVYADPAYVKKLQRGSGLVLWSMLGLIGLGVLAMVIVGVLALKGRAGDLITDLALLAGAMCFGLGWWLLCAPDHGQTGGGGEKLRGVARMGVVTLVVAAAVGVVADPLMVGSPGVQRGLRLLWQVTFAIAIIAGINYVRWLCRRLPDERLSGSATTLGALAWVFCAARVVSLMMAWAFPAGVPGVPFKLLLHGINGIGGLVGLIGFFYYISVISKFRDRLDGVAAAQRG